MTRIFDGQLHVHYGQAYVLSSEDIDIDLGDCFIGQTNGLCGAAVPGKLFLITGLHTGEVGFTLDVLDTPPPVDEAWEEIVEVSFTAGKGKVFLESWFGNCVCNIPIVQGSYRVRYCARNMDQANAVDTTVEGEPIIDFYALAFWLAPPAPDMVVKQTSSNAAYGHSWAKSWTQRQQGFSST